MKNYFADIFQSILTVLVGMKITFLHLFTRISHFNTLCRNGIFRNVRGCVCLTKLKTVLAAANVSELVPLIAFI